MVENNKEGKPLEFYLENYRKSDPAETVAKCQVPFEDGAFTVKLLGNTYRVTHPDFEITRIEDNGISYSPLEQNNYAKILILRYLTESVYIDATGKQLAYRDVPWGEVYLQQFTGRCIKRLAFSYGTKPDLFEKIMLKMGAVADGKADKAFRVELLPGLFIWFMLWVADEEFPPSSQILFSDNFPTAFKAEDLAVVGDIVIGYMKEVAKEL